LANTSGWRASAGIGRNLGAHLALLTQYVYLEYSATMQRSPLSRSQNAVRISMLWNPGSGILN
jgi:hypothetical protein